MGKRCGVVTYQEDCRIGEWKFDIRKCFFPIQPSPEMRNLVDLGPLSHEVLNWTSFYD
jgi:hypothetical protein